NANIGNFCFRKSFKKLCPHKIIFSLFVIIALPISEFGRRVLLVRSFLRLILPRSSFNSEISFLTAIRETFSYPTGKFNLILTSQLVVFLL
ncbi:hypothetical protein OAY92_01775, partial [Alphaproteobacteria bacterium]|nr:hypothetical protein [Alphaproteobacteria bacterium]